MKVKDKHALTPKPVCPRSMIHHGLFGKSFVRQHMVIDEHWTPDSLSQEFQKMNSLLKRHRKFNSLEKRVQQKKFIETYHTLQKQCRDGRSLLKLLTSGNPQEVRNILKEHRHMQRLYQKMPLHLVIENINQRTFVMRKERDRLESRLEQLKSIYERKLLDKANVENRITYENEFKLEEDTHICDLQKKVENSELRLKAVMTINSTYKKIIQILRHDEIFYEPILRSLDKDIEDQSQFIKHILYLGAPALVRFKELGEQYKLIDDKARKSSRLSMQQCTNFRKITTRMYQRQGKQQTNIIYRVRRYVRETKSMRDLKERFEEIEEIIKKIKIATLSSQEKDIYPRIKSQINNNLKLDSEIINDMMGHEVLETKMKFAAVLKGVLVNNLAEDGLIRLEKIKELKEAIKLEDEFQEKTLAHIKNRNDCFVLLRYSLWNLHDIMRYVGPRRMPQLKYPVDYLKLPLLKYEMLTMRACPPDPFEENIPILLNIVQTKLKLLLDAFDPDLTDSSINLLKDTYCNELLLANDNDSQGTQDSRYKIHLQPENEIDLIEEVKSYQKVLSRRQIKVASARLVEERIKKDE